MSWFYYRFIYRRLMKLAHRYGWHHTRRCYPDGDTLLICDWCGLRYVEKRAMRVIFTDEQSAASETPK